MTDNDVRTLVDEPDLSLHTQEADSNGVWCREDGQRWPCDAVRLGPDEGLRAMLPTCRPPHGSLDDLLFGDSTLDEQRAALSRTIEGAPSNAGPMSPVRPSPVSHRMGHRSLPPLPPRNHRPPRERRVMPGEPLTATVERLRQTLREQYIVGVPGQPSMEWRNGARWALAQLPTAALPPVAPDGADLDAAWVETFDDGTTFDWGEQLLRTLTNYERNRVIGVPLSGDIDLAEALTALHAIRRLRAGEGGKG